MDILIAKELHTERKFIYEPDGTIQKGWSHQVHRSYKIDATPLAQYCFDQPQFWGNPKGWLPIVTKPGTNFWIEYQLNDNARTELEDETGVLTTIAFHVEVSVDSTRQTLEVATFYRTETNGRSHIVRSPYLMILQLDDDNRVESVVYEPESDDNSIFKLDRENFMAVLPLTVISNIDDNDVVAVQKNARAKVPNLNSRNKKKRQKANQTAKIRYWVLEIAEPSETDDSIDDIEDERNQTNGA